MTFPRMLALGAVLVAATVASAVAPTRPAFHPPIVPYLLGALAGAAFIAAFEGWKSDREEAARAPFEGSPSDGEVVTRSAPGRVLYADDFVVSFDDRAITLSYWAGCTDSASWDEVESITASPHDDNVLFWVGPYFLTLKVGDRYVSIPACSEGLEALLGRLLEWPGIDREGLAALTGGGIPSPCVLWTREEGAGRPGVGPPGDPTENSR